MYLVPCQVNGFTALTMRPVIFPPQFLLCFGGGDLKPDIRAAVGRYLSFTSYDLVTGEISCAGDLHFVNIHAF